jgi:hypothetical protein
MNSLECCTNLMVCFLQYICQPISLMASNKFMILTNHKSSTNSFCFRKMPYLSNFGLLKVHKFKTYVFTPHDLNTQKMGTPVYHEISRDI